MSSSLLHRLSRLPRLTALVVVALLVAALAIVGGLGSRPASHRATHQPRVHLLGIKGLELAALTGKAHLYMRIPGITPAKPKAAHASDIVLSGVTWNLTTPTDSQTGLPSGRVQSTFSIKKQLDQFTPSLAAAEISNKAQKSVLIYVIPDDDPSHELLTFAMINVLVTSDHQSVTSTGSSESLTLSFQKVTEAYLVNGAGQEVSFDGTQPGT